MRRALLLPAVSLLALSLLTGCSPTRIPPPPDEFDTVVLTSDFAATELYAQGLAAFLRANWEPVTGAEGGPLTSAIRPDGERDDSSLLLRLTVRPIDPETGEPLPDLAEGDYAGPDLSRRDLNDPARGQNEVDSLRLRARTDPLTTGDAVLTVSVDGAEPGARAVLIRTARILAGVRGEISYR